MSASGREPLLLLIPAALAYFGLLILPLLVVLEESFKEFVPGRVGSAADAPFTFDNYADLLLPAYASFFWTTIYLSAVAAAICTVLALPLAYQAAWNAYRSVRKSLLILMVVMVFLSALVRVYSIQLTFGAGGLFTPILSGLGINSSSRLYIEATVVAGLLHFVLPIATLTLLGVVKSINPKLLEAAQGLGASRSWAHCSITLPLCAPGLLAAFLIAFCGSLSAFVVPLVLGKGRVLFISNLVYSRFSEVANYPSGAAISIVMLLLALILIYMATRASAAGAETRQ